MRRLSFRVEDTEPAESCLECRSGVLVADDTNLDTVLNERPRLSRRRSLVFPSLGEAMDEVLTLRLRCLRTDVPFSSVALSEPPEPYPVRLEMSDPWWSISNSSEVRFFARRAGVNELGGKVGRESKLRWRSS